MTGKNASIITDFMSHIKNADTEKFIMCMLYCFSAPTIKGIKSACLINFRRNKGENMRASWKLNAEKWLSPLGLEWLMLNEDCPGENALVLVYRRELLARALGRVKACDILAEYGYPLHDVDACLDCLRRKFLSGFPHEIGLFLDYPPDDVRGFIEGRNAEKSSCPGYWKVYGNHDEAKRIFNEYRKAECDAARAMMSGGLQYITEV